MESPYSMSSPPLAPFQGTHHATLAQHAIALVYPALPSIFNPNSLALLSPSEGETAKRLPPLLS